MKISQCAGLENLRVGSAAVSVLGDHVALQRGTTYKSALLDQPGPYLLGLGSIARNGGFRSDSLRSYGGESSEKMILRPGDIYVSLKDVTQAGDILGAVARVPPEVSEGRLTQDTVKLNFRSNDTPRNYIYWLLRTTYYRSYCRARAMGTTNLSLSREDFLAFVVPLPTPAQLALTRLLDVIDDKIVLNGRIVETLEAMARALFKSWFVDFDPVRAKSEGRRPAGMDAETAKLFPDSFDGLGQFPNGWNRAALGDWVTALSGGTPSKSDATLWGGDIPWISPKAMKEIHADESDESVTPRAIGNGTRLALAGSTLVMVRGMGLHEKVRVSQARRDVSFNQDVKALVPSGIEASLLLFALLDAQQTLLGKVESSGHGTGKLASEILLAHPVTMPPAPVQRELATKLEALNAYIASARGESRTLAELRDTLLPKLISGEIRIKEAEKLASAAL